MEACMMLESETNPPSWIRTQTVLKD